MAAPFPYESQAGVSVDTAESEAGSLYRQYAWIARLSDEMNDEAELDLKRTMQFAFHCAQFRRWRDALQARIGQGHTASEITSLIEGYFAFKKCRWATRATMLDELQAIYDGAGDITAWIAANATEYKQGFSTNVILADGVMTDVPVKRVKSAEIATRLAAFRALFGPKS